MKKVEHKQFKHALCWLRRDLRLRDHAALAAASDAAHTVTVVFVYDSVIIDALPFRQTDRRMQYIFESLVDIDRELADRHNSCLVVAHGKAWDELPRLALQLQADAVFCNRDYEGYAGVRDRRVRESLQSVGVSFVGGFKDQVIFEANELSKADGAPYQMFTPYSRAWLKKFAPQLCHEKSVTPNFTPRQALAGAYRSDYTLASLGIGASVNPPALRGGRAVALQTFESFLSESVNAYASQRDCLALPTACSQLGAALRFGCLSIREVVGRVRSLPGSGAQGWLRQLIWREFYQMILSCYPHVETETFRPEYRQLEWPGRQDHLQLWQQGLTGYPIVDAAMRHFYDSGLMPNRLRMIVASFLCKDLLLDYRLGEAWFAGRLFDFDLAANNGNWQWSASTGCDAQPYFRVFNPVLQSRKFDPTGQFIRKHLPELRKLDTKDIHWPAGAPRERLAACGVRLGKDYPNPIVEHGNQSMKAQALFKNAKAKVVALEKK